MRFRGLALYPLVYAAVFATVAWLLLDSETLDPFADGQRLLLRILAIVGCVAAATVFERGEHLRRAWWLLGLGAILILVRDVLRLPMIDVPSEGRGFGPVMVRSLGVGSNLASLAGLALLAFTWKKASVSLPGGRWAAVAVTLVAIALALVLGGPPALKQAQNLAAGNEGALILLVSAAVDILAFALLAPLLLTALAFRGGTIFWPWALLSANIFCWLLYDAAATHPILQPFPLTEVFRGLAVNYLFVAGLAQRFAVQRVHGDAAQTPSFGR